MQHEPENELPAPDASSAAHSELVANHVREKIAAAGGRISFAEFMHEVLYAPGLGYYSAGTTKFGAAGDFVTAPEVASIYGQILARQCAAVLSEIDGAAVLEFGAGSGRLAVDVLRKLDSLGAVPSEYRILEVSADLRERQASLLRAELPQLVDRVTWLDRLPNEHVGVIIANEVIDALPVERFVRRKDCIAQLMVVPDGKGFAFAELQASETLAAAVMAIEHDIGDTLAEGYASEVSLALPGWIGDVAGTLRRGIAFLFDYGVSRREYYAIDRTNGWLRCHFRHHAHSDPLRLPGIQDITSWVDFTAVASAAIDHGLEIAGYVTQSRFLLDGGLVDELAELADMPLGAQLELSAQVKTLTLPGEMGENFKCLGLSRGKIVTPSALIASDRTTSL